MLLLSVLLVSLAVGLVRGGNLMTFAGHRWSWPALPLLAVAIQVVGFLPDESASPAARVFAASLHVLSYVLLLAFVWINRRIRWMWLLGLGLAANVIAIGANGGFMPVSPEFAGLSNAEHAAGPYNNTVRMHGGTRLWFLSDIFETPNWVSIKRTFSAGDVMIAAGTFALIQSLMAAGRRRRFAGAS